LIVFLSCIVAKKYFIVHGGLSPELIDIAELKTINRFCEIPIDGIIALNLFSDILWSDPVDDDLGECDPIFKENPTRGSSFMFGKDAVKVFLKKNKLISIIRGHECMLEGYKFHKWDKNSDFPLVITIFSAPNYCDTYKNKGSIIKFEV